MKKLFFMAVLGIGVFLCFSQFAQGEVKTLVTLKDQVDPETAAVLVIDMQNDYIADKGVLGKIGLNVKRVQEMVPRLNRFIEEARKKGVMIIWITQTHTLKDAMPNYLAGNMRIKRDKPFTEDDFIVKENSWGAEYYDKMIKPLQGEITVRKHTYGGFTNTNLDMYLRVAGKKTIICTGTNTNVCVLSTALEGYHKGYYSIIVSDCSETTDPLLQEVTLKNWDAFFGYAAKGDEIVDIWKK